MSFKLRIESIWRFLGLGYINYYEPEITRLNEVIFSLTKDLEGFKKQNEEFIKKIEELTHSSPEEYYWNNRFIKKPVIYIAQDGVKRDVRTLLCDKSDILQQIIRKNNLKTNYYPSTVYKIEQWVRKNIKYTSDAGEFWKHPENTVFDFKGDCEDGMLVIKSLALIAGVPDYMLKCVAGYVSNNEKQEGHAYCIFLFEGNWKTIDWCYWPTSQQIEKRINHKLDSKYLNIWFTFTKEYGFSDTEIEVEGRVKTEVENMGCKGGTKSKKKGGK